MTKNKQKSPLDQKQETIILNTTPGLHYTLNLLGNRLKKIFCTNHLLTPFLCQTLELFQKQIINFSTLLVLLILWPMSLE